MTVKGIAEIQRNLEREIAESKKRLSNGLLRAGLFLQGESQEVVPQKQGVLINSAFTDVDRDALIARVGYTAEYAPFVHEMPETYNYTKPGTGPKFLERPAKENRQAMLKIMAKAGEVK